MLPRMSHPKRPPKRQITIRLPQELFEKLEADSTTRDWAISDEINFQLRSRSIDEKIDKLEAEISELKAMIRELSEK